jgi:hypothetical protein
MSVSEFLQMFFVALTTYVLAALTMTAAVIVGSEATASLASLVDSVSSSSCPATAATSSTSPADANRNTDLSSATTTTGAPNDTSIETIGVDLDALALNHATSCENSKRVFGTPTGSGWCDDGGGLGFARARVGVGIRFDPGTLTSRELNEALPMAVGKWELLEDARLGKFSERLDAIPPLLAGLEKREIPQSTRIFLS